jgi:hypothetical protein
VLISKSPPAVNADAHDHGERRPSNNDATLVHTPIASKASTTGNPRPAGGTSDASSARAHRRKCAATSSDRDRNRRRQSRTVSPGTPSRSPARRYPSRPAENSAAPITSTTYRRRARHTSGSSTCVARHDRSRQRPRRGRNRRTPAPVQTTRNREQPQPPSTPSRQRGHINRPAARSASTTARSSETMSTTTSNGVTGSLVSPRQVSAREPNMNRTTTILSPGRPQAFPHHHARCREPPPPSPPSVSLNTGRRADHGAVSRVG